MRRLILILLILTVSVIFGLQIAKEPGYVLIAYHHYIVETSFWVAVAAAFLFIVLILGLLKVFESAKSASKWIWEWPSRRRKRIARKNTQQGLYDLIKGNWKLAEKHLQMGLKHSETPLINYIGIAKAAAEQEQLKLSQETLDRATEKLPQEILTIELSRARLHINTQHWEEAAICLENLHAKYPDHVYSLQLLIETYIYLKRWQPLKPLMPVFEKNAPKNLTKIEQLKEIAYQNLLANASSLESLSQLWQTLPYRLHKDPQLIKVYAEKLIAYNELDSTETLLKEILKKNWDSELIKLYGLIHSSHADKQLQFAESWLKQYPQDPNLLLCLGRLCRYNQLWGKARSYLETSNSIAPNPETLLELAELAEQLGDTLQANKFYAQGLKELI